MLLLTGPSPGRPGGVATFVRTLSGVLVVRCPRLEWELVVTDKGGTGAVRRVTGGLSVARRLRAKLRSSRPTLVHLCCGSDRSGWGLREAAVHVALARRAGARVLLHLHASGFEHLWSRRIERLHISRTLAAADGVAVLSAGQRTRLIELGLPADRTFVIPNGVEVPARAPLPRRDVTEDAPLRLLLVGSVEQRKGLVELLEALAVVRRERGPRVRVDVLGPAVAPPAELHRWRTRGQEVGLRMLGPVSPDEIAERLAASDGLVLPSHAEGLPFVLLEAMAATRPVLASRVGAIPELLEGAGELVEPGSVSELTGALLRWVDDPDRRADLAVRGWRRVRDSASTEVCAAAVFEAWAGTLRSGSGAEALELLSRPTREAQSR